VNHELKTPLTIQRSYLEFLKESELNEDQSLYLEKSLDGSNRLEKLISEILYFLKVQKEDLKSSTDTFELSEATGIQDLTGSSITTHKTYFCDAIKRLVENAEAHKLEKSSINISQSLNEITISNKIEKDLDLDLILKPFEINEDAFNHTKGLGMGLSIASLILTKLGYGMHLSSENKTFTVTVHLSGQK